MVVAFGYILGQSNDAPNGKDILNIPVPEGRQHLTGKVRHAFTFAYQTLNNSFDWILKCDDDTYIIMENLRQLLSLVDRSSSAYLGFHMKVKNYLDVLVF